MVLQFIFFLRLIFEILSRRIKIYLKKVESLNSWFRYYNETVSLIENYVLCLNDTLVKGAELHQDLINHYYQFIVNQNINNIGDTND